MAAHPIRFIHASDFHLDRLPQDLAEIPDHLRERLATAATRAATKVFDAAINEQVDFVILSGDIVSLQDGSPADLLFLVDQFQRLAARDIAVFWLDGRAEASGEWPPECAMPPGVHQFPTGRVMEHVVQRKGQPVARILGQSYARGTKLRPRDFEPEDEDELPVIAVAHAKLDAAALTDIAVSYWALGGQHNAKTIATGMHAAHYSGSPQGRRLRDTGSHGCTLVRIDGSGRASLSSISTDVLRYEYQQIVLGDETTREELEADFRKEVERLRAQAAHVDRLVAWSVTGTGPLLESIRRGALGIELLTWLRTEFGHSDPALWTLELVAEPIQEHPADWYEQDTLLGDFLRTVKTLDEDDEGSIDLQQYVDDEALVEVLGSRLRFDAGHSRQQLLQQVALLGIDLLGGEEPRA